MSATSPGTVTSPISRKALIAITAKMARTVHAVNLIFATKKISCRKNISSIIERQV